MLNSSERVLTVLQIRKEQLFQKFIFSTNTKLPLKDKVS